MSFAQVLGWLFKRYHDVTVALLTGLMLGSVVTRDIPDAVFAAGNPCRVIRAIGERAAHRYFLTAEVFGAEEALRIGMLSLLVPAAELDRSIDDLLGHLLAGGPQAHGKIKELIRAVAGRPVDPALMADTARRIADIRVSPEGREGIASFLDKRKPGWCSPKS